MEGGKWWAGLSGGLEDRRGFLGGYASSKLVGGHLRAPFNIVFS
jgi:hypothetical protein